MAAHLHRAAAAVFERLQKRRPHEVQIDGRAVLELAAETIAKELEEYAEEDEFVVAALTLLTQANPDELLENWDTVRPVVIAAEGYRGRRERARRLTKIVLVHDPEAPF